jgi:CheY-like chemotaxis protein
VDDNEGIRNLTCKILEAAGYAVLAAPTGAIALTLIGEKPDLVLQDLVLPDITGYDLVQKLRAASANPELPILAFTSYLDGSGTNPDLKEDFGFDALLTKPIQNAQLLEAVRAHLVQ